MAVDGDEVVDDDDRVVLFQMLFRDEKKKKGGITDSNVSTEFSRVDYDFCDDICAETMGLIEC